MPELITKPDGTKALVRTTLEETGHVDMLSRVRAFHKMLISLEDDWEAFTTGDILTQEDRRPKWLERTDGALHIFIKNMFDKFSLQKLEEIEITAKQFFWMKDTFDKANEI